MSDFKFLDAYRCTSPLIQSAIDFIVSLNDEDDCQLNDIDDNKVVLYFNSNPFRFVFSEIDAFTFSVKGIYDTHFIFEKVISDMIYFEEFFKNCYNTGFSDYISDYLEDNLSDNIVSGDFFERAIASDTDLDEIDSSTLDNEMNKLVSIESIVPDIISKIRVVALRYNCQIIAFRFKTDVGAFDMRIEVATKYGLGGFKTEKFINLEKVNGILMSSTEKQKRVCVPDVSLCEEDCRRLIDAVFQCEG